MSKSLVTPSESSGAPDPVAERAAKEAVEATNPPPVKYPWITRGALILGIFVLIIGSAALFFSAYNNVQTRKVAVALQKQVECNTALIAYVENQREVTSAIAADDRKAVDDVVNATSRAINSGHPERIVKAFDTYNRERVANDRKRTAISKIPLPPACRKVTVDNRLYPTPSATSTTLPPSVAPPTPKKRAHVTKPAPKRSGASASTTGSSKPSSIPPSCVLLPVQVNC